MFRFREIKVTKEKFYAVKKPKTIGMLMLII